MREIKFRAFHKIREEIYDVYCFTPEHVFKVTMDGIGQEGNPDNREDVKLLQFTGCKDANGNDIYEDDIVYDSTEHIYDFVLYNPESLKYDCASNDLWPNPENGYKDDTWIVKGNRNLNPYFLELGN